MDPAPDTEVCPVCYGRGDVIRADGSVNTCPRCGGSGEVPKHRTAYVEQQLASLARAPRTEGPGR